MSANQGQTSLFAPQAYDSLRLMPLGEFMKKIEIRRYYNVGSLVQFLMLLCDSSTGENDHPHNSLFLKNELQEIREALKEVDMAHSFAQVEHIESCSTIEGSNASSWRDIKAKLASLNVAANSELKTMFVGYIPSDRARLWGMERPFGDRVYECFPSARADLTSAGNCHAVAEYTACVFHSMRVVEKGLRALARERKIAVIKDKPLEWNDWGKIIQAIEAQANLLVTKIKMGPVRDRALEFYRGAAGELYGFKDAYRNYVTHDRATYDMGQALSAYHRVGEFMQRLATQLDETNRKPIKWKK